jgi:uncharacterized RDD family membrane protein YckC
MTTSANDMPRDQPAGFWRRIFAGVFDILLLLTTAMVLFLELVVAVSAMEFYGGLTMDTPDTRAALWIVLAMVWYGTSAILLPILYYTLAEGAYGQTLGKALFGIIVVSADGHPIGYGRAFARLLTLPYALIPAGLGLLWAALPPAKRAWHDYITATRVIVAAQCMDLHATADQEEAVATSS